MDSKTLAALQACVDHAKDLLNAARVVDSSGHPNIAYHLAALALEELGRRELLGVQSIAHERDASPAWPVKHTQSHTQKLFWAFFGGAFQHQKLTRQSLDEMRRFAEQIHSKRLGGLYVNVGELGPEIPADAISPEESKALVDLAEARLGMAESLTLREHIPPEEIETQKWFLRATDDPEKRKLLFSSKSMDKLAELQDAKQWVAWLRAQFEQAEQEGRIALERELNRKRPDVAKNKNKWKLKIRIFSDSHSIRPKALAKWNKTVNWIKLTAVPEKKKELIVEFILGDNVPLQGLWFFGWGLARHFVTALNIGTMGFFWWRLPKQISRFYESLEDLESQSRVIAERNPILKVDWGENRVLTENDLTTVAQVFAALPPGHRREEHGPYNYYIGGLTFLAINDIHWQCELNAFGNFLKSLQEMMAARHHWAAGTPFGVALGKFLDEMFPNMDERDKFVELADRFAENDKELPTVTLKEAAFMKLFCDSYFLKEIRPSALAARTATMEKDGQGEIGDEQEGSNVG